MGPTGAFGVNVYSRELLRCAKSLASSPALSIIGGGD